MMKINLSFLLLTDLTGKGSSKQQQRASRCAGAHTSMHGVRRGLKGPGGWESSQEPAFPRHLRPAEICPGWCGSMD